MNSKNTAEQRLGEDRLTLTAYLNVRLEKHSDSHKRNPMDVFRASVQKWPEVVECHALTGDMDYLLRVVVRNMAHYSLRARHAAQAPQRAGLQDKLRAGSGKEHHGLAL